MLFYRIANNEVHPTFGMTEIVTDVRLPLPAAPLVPIGVTHAVGELSLEFQTAMLLSNMTHRVTKYTTLTNQLQEQVSTLGEIAAAVLQDLK